MVEGRLKELKRVEMSLYSARAGKGSRSALGREEFESGLVYLRISSVYCSRQRDGRHKLKEIVVRTVWHRGQWWIFSARSTAREDLDLAWTNDYS